MRLLTCSSALLAFALAAIGCAQEEDRTAMQQDALSIDGGRRIGPWWFNWQRRTSDGGVAGASGAGADAGAGGGWAEGGAAGQGVGGQAGEPLDSFQAEVSAVSSTRATISWEAAGPATETRVFVGSEPPASPGGPLADQQLVATLEGTASSQEITNLAPSTDLFVRVERDEAGGTVRDDVRVRTTGGPRVTLDGPVRAVHGFGARVLMIVVANGSGSSWQSGGWTVTRADGSPIGVSSVRRHSIPVGAPDYVVGYGKPYSDSVIDVDHRLYLQLAEPLGSHDLLRVQGPNGVDMTVPFSDRYLEAPSIQVNQVGYNPRASQRWAYVSGWMGDGGPMSFSGLGASAQVLKEPQDTATAPVVVLADVPITQRSANDPSAGGEVRQVDLSQVPAQEGARYRVRIPGVGVSWPTAVSELAALKSFYVLTRGMFYNRWGVELAMPASQFLRGADHTTIYTADSTSWTGTYSQSTPKTGQRTLIGGYHDAGDFDQRPMHTVVAELLLRAYELHPGSYADGQLHLPESGNGIPDLLDEALWGVRGWEMLQEADGGVRNGAESYRHPWAFYHADQDPLTYWTWARGANVTGRAAGLFAQAARLVAPFDPARSAALTERAKRAYTWASANGASNAARIYAASELYRLTGQATYKTAFEQIWGQIGTYGAFSNFASEQQYMGDYTGSGRVVADFILGYLGAPDASPSIRSASLTQLTNMANSVANTTQQSRAHRHPAGASHPQDWGGLATTAKYTDTLLAMLQLGGLAPDQQQKYFDALSLSADYVLGGNPNGYVYVSGLGSRKVEEPLHLDSLAYVKEKQGVMPGIPVYGPVDGAPGTSWTAATVAAYYPSFNNQPKGLRYGDVRTLVTCNEFTIWETQAPLAAMFAALMGPATMPPASWAPGQPDHLHPLP
jgi:endoglucanase